jgi:hypothetical protein
MRRIRITADDISATATLNDSSTADAIWDALPLEAQANTWGEEIYFGIPVHLNEADGASEVVDMGDLGYWPTGHAFCIFFGRTPASKGDEIRAASAVNVFGRVEGDAMAFAGVHGGANIRIEKAED